MNMQLLKAELRKVWSFPILELAVCLVTLITITSIYTLQEIALQSEYQSFFSLSVVKSFASVFDGQLLLLGLFCGILLTLSFARDYEQGQMQTLLSAPISRSTLFIVKFVAVLVPLTLISWGITTAVITINFYYNVTSVFTILGFATVALPFMLLALMFYGGLATLIALSIRRAIPSALTILLIGFLTFFITTLKESVIGNLANYLCLTSFKAPFVAFGKICGMSYAENTIEAAMPTGVFVGLTVVFALVLLIPMYLYFTRRFEIRD